MIVFAAIVPHPPYSIPGVGTADEKKKIRKTLDSFREIRDGLEKAKPDLVVVISPHGKMERYNFVINSDPVLRGSFSDFGLDEAYEFKNDIEMINLMTYACEMNDIFVHLHSYFLDHGALVPLVNLLKDIRPDVVHMSFSLMTYEKHYEYGEVIANVFKKSPKRIAVIASGDLSHCLTPEAPAGYFPRAKFFDQRVIEYLANDDIKSLMGLRKEFVKESCECGMRSIIIMLGMMNEKKYKFNFLSYEAPFGIGYLVARLI